MMMIEMTYSISRSYHNVQKFKVYGMYQGLN